MSDPDPEPSTTASPREPNQPPSIASRAKTVAFVLTIAVVVGLVAFLGGRLSAGPGHSAEPRTIEGWASNVAGGGMGCCAEDKSDAGGESYNVTGAAWRNLRSEDRSWHFNPAVPTCLSKEKQNHVRLGIVDVDDGRSPVRDRVIWVECL